MIIRHITKPRLLCYATLWNISFQWLEANCHPRLSYSKKHLCWLLSLTNSLTKR